MSDAVALHRPAVIETDSSSSFVCDYVAGINRVVSLHPYLVVDNIGRNVEVWRFESTEREPAARTLYDRTSYPDDPIASLLDVDLHAAFLRRDAHELLVVNHYGRVRRFEVPVPASQTRIRPAGELQLLGDTERIVMAGDCFITSSPRGEFTDDPSRPGIFLFEPTETGHARTSGGDRRLAWEQELATWGVVSALAVPRSAHRLAVAAGQRLGVFELTCSRAGLRLGDCIWEATLGFDCQWLHVDETDRLWAGGHRPLATVDGEDWDACRGGGISSFVLDSGACHFTISLPEATAWGYGADPIVLAPGSAAVYVLGRDASLHVIDLTAGAAHQLYSGLETPPGAPPLSLGIGHAALRADWIYAGFSRDGFRLLRYDVHRPSLDSRTGLKRV